MNTSVVVVSNYSKELLDVEYERRRPIRDALRRLKQSHAICHQDVAELGSGLGFNLDIFAADCRVVGIEGLGEAADSATSRGIPTIVADLASTVPLESEKYDLVLCVDVLEHLLDPTHCVEEARRILKPNGLLVVNVPNHFTLSGRLRIILGSGIDSIKFFPQRADWNYPHVRFFRHSSIVELLDRCKLQIDEDWSGQFPSIPVVNRFNNFSGFRVGKFAASHWPNLFAGGFFLLARRGSGAQRGSRQTSHESPDHQQNGQ
jgi:SAM-dependent methyltransferase